MRTDWDHSRMTPKYKKWLGVYVNNMTNMSGHFGKIEYFGKSSFFAEVILREAECTVVSI